jgi:hypothetical protein
MHYTATVGSHISLHPGVYRMHPIGSVSDHKFWIVLPCFLCFQVTLQRAYLAASRSPTSSTNCSKSATRPACHFLAIGSVASTLDVHLLVLSLLPDPAMILSARHLAMHASSVSESTSTSCRQRSWRSHNQPQPSFKCTWHRSAPVLQCPRGCSIKPLRKGRVLYPLSRKTPYEGTTCIASAFPHLEPAVKGQIDIA